jgi:3-phenylpropionate/cinnamic acid dioxygenase small subunit
MSGVADLELTFRIQQFLYLEADLLDNREYDEWLSLLHPDVRFFVPLVRNVPRARDTEFTAERLDMAWMDEGYETISKRVSQIKTNIHWAEEPPSRVSHLVTNTRIVGVDDEKDGRRVTAHSRIFVYQNRIDDEVNMFVGKRADVLVESGDDWLIQHREVRLDQSVLLAKALTVFL